MLEESGLLIRIMGGEYEVSDCRSSHVVSPCTLCAFGLNHNISQKGCPPVGEVLIS